MGKIIEHGGEGLEGHGHVAVAVQNTDGTHDEEGADALEAPVGRRRREPREPFAEFLVQRLAFTGDEDDHAVEQTPDDEVPGCPVPQARQKPRHEGSQIHGKPHTDGLTQMGTAPLGELLHGPTDGEGVEDVIRKPGAHGDVPAVPVFGGGLGGEGAVKVFGEPQAQHAGEADGDVDAPRKVAVDDGGV